MLVVHTCFDIMPAVVVVDDGSPPTAAGPDPMEAVSVVVVHVAAHGVLLVVFVVVVVVVVVVGVRVGIGIRVGCIMMMTQPVSANAFA